MAETTSRQQLLREIGELRARLEETEGTLDSLRRGTADAVVVRGPSGDHVMTLQDADQPYRVIVECIQEGAVTLSATGEILFCNLSFADMLRTPISKVMGRPLGFFVYDADRALFDSLLTAGRRSGAKGEVGLSASDGTLVPAYLSVSPLPLAGPDGVCIVVTDLTAQKRNAEIVASEKLARAILDHAAEATVVCDERGRIIRSCRAAEQLCGTDPLREHFDSVFPLAFRSGQTVIRPYADSNGGSEGPGYPLSRALRGETLVGIEAEFTRPDGLSFDLMVTAGPVRGEQNEVLGCVVTLIDITDRKRAEEALRLSEERYRFLAEALPLFIWSTLPDGSLDYCNRHWYEFTGLTEQQAQEEGWMNIVHPDDRQHVIDLWERAKSDLEPYTVECRLRRASDGVYVWHFGRVFPVKDSQGNLLKWLGTAGSIQDRKRAEREHEIHMEQVRSLNARLQRAMAETHHRVKNNLQVISALIDLQILNGDEMVPSGELKRLSQHVRTLASVHDLLTQEIKDEGDISTVSAEATIEQLVPLIQSMAGPERSIRIAVQDAKLPVKQGTSLAVLINEMVSNAVKHGNGDIELNFAVIGDVARLEVSDQGIGFPHDFDPKRQANTGMELIESLSRWDLQGQTSYENRSEGGARVVVTFPL